MSTNLLELLNAHLTEDVVSKISNFIGESNKNTGSALGRALPSLLSGLMDKSSDSQGANILYNLLTQNANTSLLSNLGASLVGGDVTAKLANAGSSLLGSIFGNKTDAIANLVSNDSGISKTSASSLLGLVTPLLFAVLGKTLKVNQITSPAGLASLLEGQSGFLKNLLPAGLAGILGTGAAMASAGSSSIGTTTTSTSSTISSSTATAATKPAATVTMLNKDKDEVHVAPVVRERKIVPPSVDDDDDAGIFGKLLPWLILGSLLALGWGIWKNLKKPVDGTAPVAAVGSDTAASSSTSGTADATATPPAVATTDTAASGDTSSATGSSGTPPADGANATASGAASTTANTDGTGAGSATASTTGDGTTFNQKLSSGFELKAPADSMESKLYAFINDANAPIDEDKWFNMDGILFDTGKATLRPESRVQINNIIEILKAFPKVNIKMGGYTDNTGNPNANQKLSANRANAILAAIVKAGIDKGRLAAEGYGSNHPVASNDTAEGRQKNRRIDVKVTAK
jgi:OmpA-OmpF porin, OOP family